VCDVNGEEIGYEGIITEEWRYIGQARKLGERERKKE